jgi:aspartate dehydrogenase
MRVGLLGLGAIGRDVVRLCAPIEAEVDLIGVYSRSVPDPYPAGWPARSASLEALLMRQPDVVVEAMGHEGLREFGPRVLRAGCDLLIVSVGALAEPAVHDALLAAAHEGGSRVHVASGAIGALDAVAAAAVGEVRRVTHTTRKPAHALLAPDDAAALTAPRELFRGSAREGALRFPESINVAAAVSLAGIGLDRTEVCVIADPALTRNTHQVDVEGVFGRLRFEIENLPSELNPRTGRLTAMSVVHALRRRRATFVVG